MTAADAFLARILANPDDDTPRLVFADWLQDHDDRVPCPGCGGTGHPPPVMYPARERRVADGRVERYIELPPFDYRIPKCSRCSGSGSVPAGNAARAEFIRCQIELAKANPCEWVDEPWNRRRLACKEWNEQLTEGRVMTTCNTCRSNSISDRRSSALLRAHGPAWSGEVADALGVDQVVYHERAGWFSPYHFLNSDGLPSTGWKFGRGFVEVVRLPDLASFVGDRACPTCEYNPGKVLENPGPDGRWVTCASCSGLGRVRACWNCPLAGTRCDCPYCSGSGTLPALAPRLARVPGITEVWCLDRVPNNYGPPEDGCRYGWLSEHEPYAGEAALPSILLKLLVPHNPLYGGRYPTAPLALQSLALDGGGLLAGLRNAHTPA